MMQRAITFWAPMALCGLASLGAQAQSQPPAAGHEPMQVLSLSASARKEVPQDWLTVVVRANVEGSDAATVQGQLKSVLERAQALLRPQTQPGQLEVHTGSLGVYPRSNAQGRWVGWQGQADLVLEGRDFALIGQAAGSLPRMVVHQADFSLSREGRLRLEAEVQSQAVQSFRQRAQALAADFGFSGYTLRQVSVSTAERPAAPVMQARLMDAGTATAAGAAPIPLLAGQDEVRITVSGSIQLR